MLLPFLHPVTSRLAKVYSLMLCPTMQASGSSFAQTGHAMRLLEGVAVALQQQEPALLVGETGTGKTTLVQRLADQVGTPTYTCTCTCMLGPLVS